MRIPRTSAIRGYGMDHSSHHTPDSRVSSNQGQRRRMVTRSAGIAFLYLFIAWAIHAGAINPLTHLIGGGDGFIQGIAAKTFATSFGSWNPLVHSGNFVFPAVFFKSSYPPVVSL